MAVAQRAMTPIAMANIGNTTRVGQIGIRAGPTGIGHTKLVRLGLERVPLGLEILPEMEVINRRRALRQHGGYKDKIKIIEKATAERGSKLTTAVAAAETVLSHWVLDRSRGQVA